jgi:hypothetical protein
MRLDVRYGSLADMAAAIELVRFLTINGTPLVCSRTLRIDDAQNWDLKPPIAMKVEAFSA